MKSTEKFMRGIQVAAAEIVGSMSLMGEPSLSHDDLSKVDDAVKVLGDAITIIADHDKQAKARAERIQWIHVAAGVYVTRAGRNTFRLMEDGDSLSLQIDNGGVGCVSFEEIDTTTSIESASRKIRAWRKKQ